jgi:hypothetical protein
MRIRIKTTVNIPEVPSEVAMGTGTLRDVFKKVFGNTHFAKEIIDPRTGEISLDSLFDVRLLDAEPRERYSPGKARRHHVSATGSGVSALHDATDIWFKELRHTGKDREGAKRERDVGKIGKPYAHKAFHGINSKSKGSRSQ